MSRAVLFPIPLALISTITGSWRTWLSGAKTAWRLGRYHDGTGTIQP
jgi:hypothetical protein